MSDTNFNSSNKISSEADLKVTSSILKLIIALFKNKWALVSIFWLFFIIVIAIFASEISPLDPNKNYIMERVSPPLTLDKDGNMKYIIGSDALGRDCLSRLIYGAQVSLLVGFSAVIIGGFIISRLLSSISAENLAGS